MIADCLRYMAAVRFNDLEPPCTDPYARWCGRGRRATAAPMPIRVIGINRIRTLKGCADSSHPFRVRFSDVRFPGVRAKNMRVPPANFHTRLRREQETANLQARINSNVFTYAVTTAAAARATCSS